MYFLIYGFLYLFSLLPFFILYRISDAISFILYHVVKYRRGVVRSNLTQAFPEKNLMEIKKIEKKFYRNFTDAFIETIKLISISEKSFSKMASMDLEMANKIAATGKSIQFEGGHQFNWELANWITARDMKIPFVGVYHALHNKSFDKIFYDIRCKTGTVLVSTKEFRNKMHQLLNTQYSIGLAADQNPNDAGKAYWMMFFGRPVPFIHGPERSAVQRNNAIIFVKQIKVKRGCYRFEPIVITENGADWKDGDLTKAYRDLLEQTIREQPDNYLWTHRRWKWEYREDFKERWFDTQPPA
jgi:KDO2-lipid IV(A) lauroyltransferase